MRLLIDSDQNKKTGWQVYDLAINWEALSSTKSTYAKWIDGQWKTKGNVAISYRGKNLEIAVENSIFPRQQNQGFDFKWADNVSLKSIDSLFLEGDVAPDRRFNFRY